MPNQNEANEHACESLCFACKIKPGMLTCEHSFQDSSKTETLAVPVQVTGDVNDLKTDKLFEMIKRGEVSIHL